MVLKVRAGVPLVWRSPSSLQFGVDAPLVVLDGVDAGIERMISALVRGVSSSGFDMIARGAGVSVEAARALLQRLEPVLETESAPADFRVAVEGDSPLADELRAMLRAEGALAAPDDDAPSLAVIVAGWVISPEDHGSWLRRDIPHLPVVIGDGGVTVGPLVEPGSGPCLYCVQLTRTDDDPAWPAIATQLWNRPAPTMTRLEIAEAATFTARRVLERSVGDSGEAEGAGDGGAVSWRVATADGAVSSRAWTRHALCRCATPAESDWALAADPASRPATTRAEAVAVPA